MTHLQALPYYRALVEEAHRQVFDEERHKIFTYSYEGQILGETEADINETILSIQDACVKYNPKFGITGAIFFYPISTDGPTNGCLQILEGRKDHVMRLVWRIRRDRRLKMMACINSGFVEKRSFPNWAMKLWVLPEERIYFQTLLHADLAKVFNLLWYGILETGEVFRQYHRGTGRYIFTCRRLRCISSRVAHLQSLFQRYIKVKNQTPVPILPGSGDDWTLRRSRVGSPSIWVKPMPSQVCSVGRASAMKLLDSKFTSVVLPEACKASSVRRHQQQTLNVSSDCWQPTPSNNLAAH